MKKKVKKVKKVKSVKTTTKNNKFIKFIKNNYKKLIVPIISIILFVLLFKRFGIVRSLIVTVALNIIYIVILKIFKNDKNLTKEQRKKANKKRLKIFLLVLLTCFILGIVTIIGFFAYIVIKAPDFNEELLYVTDPTIVLNKNGEEIAKMGAEKRVTITYDEIPEVLIDAILATEDSRFFEHKGVDWPRFLKASILQLLGSSNAGGASTLTMQVSKNTFTSDEATGIEGIIRKFTDVYVSLFKIEKNYTKEQILEFYVNTYYMGNNAHGVEQVARTYFNKSAKDLNLSEAAMIAGLFQAPGRYNPYKNPEATEKRRQTVLYLMKRHGYINDEEYKIAKSMTVDKIVIPKEESIYVSGEVSPYQSFLDTMAEEVKDKTGYNPYTKSMIINSTLDTDIQNYLNDIMNGVSYSWENEKVQAGIAITSIEDGSIVAIGGGRNIEAIDTYNYATDIENQIGSTAKPLYDYGPGIEYNNWSSYKIFVDEPITYTDGNPINNWDGGYEGFETARTALKGSRNIPALKAFKLNDKSQIIEFVTNLGLTPEIYSCKEGYKRDGKKCISTKNPDDVIDAIKANTLHEAHAIGGYNGESPLSMAAAYSAFGRGGTYIKPYTFTKLTYQDTNEEYINNIEKTRAMSEDTAYIISDMLATTATQAMSGYYNINGIRYAAKTGTTNYTSQAMEIHNMPYGAVNDLWTIGFNTEYAIGLWYGYDNIDNEYCNKFNTGQHLRLFQAVGKKVFTNGNYFTQPSGVVAVEVESGSPEAILPSEFTPGDLRQTELFIRGTEPTTISTRFSKLSDVSNLKATVNKEKVTLTWDAVKTPEINNTDYLRKSFSTVFENQGYLDNYLNSRLEYNKYNIGEIGYNIYLKGKDGKLKLLDFSTSNKYETKLDENGDYTFVVKTAYSIFKLNMSDGKQVSATIKDIKQNTPTTPSTPDDKKDDNKQDDKKDNQDDKNDNSNQTNN